MANCAIILGRFTKRGCQSDPDAQWELATLRTHADTDSLDSAELLRDLKLVNPQAFNGILYHLC